MVKITKVYTGQGDSGSTHLLGADQIRKTDDRIQACGLLDELNASLAFAIANMKKETENFAQLIQRSQSIQQELFELGAHIVRHEAKLSEVLTRSIQTKVARLETEIDEYNDALQPLTSFILPGGGETSVRLHLARTVCRRCEIMLIKVADLHPSLTVLISYLNRLSDWFFVTARWVALQLNVEELLWEPEAQTDE